MKNTLMTLVIALGMTLGINAVTSEKMEEKIAEKNVEENFTTDLFFVQSKSQKGFVFAQSIDGDFGYVFSDDEYELGDVVEVKYWNEDLWESKKVTGKKLKSVQAKYAGKINFFIDEL